MAAAVCNSVLSIPVQTTDSIVPILQAQQMPSVLEATLASARSTAYLRPLRIGQIQLLYELAKDNGRYFLVFKGFHVGLVVAAFALFIAALRVRTAADFLAATFALTVLTGLHTFLGTVWEAYPINHFLEIAVLCLAAFVLTQSRGGWWADLAACLVFVVASLTLESGLLVWVVLVAARLVGLRGVSATGIVAVTLLLGGYMYLRFYVLGTGAPALIERNSGFGIERLEPAQLVERFGDNPYVFYAYNVVTSFLSVLFSEPRAGIWTVPLQLKNGGGLMRGTIVNMVSSALNTGVIVWAAAHRWREWVARRFTSTDQIVFVALAMLAGNAVLSYGYTKDEIMSPAGMFYALAAFAGVREAVLWASTRPAAARIVLSLILVVAACGWVVRTVGVHYNMRRIAFNVRNVRVIVDEWLVNPKAAPTTADGRRIVQTLRDDAIGRAVTSQFLRPA